MEDKYLKYTKFFLENGVKCILHKRGDVHSISVSVSVGIGSLDEDESTNGISHFLEHLPFDGTEKLRTWVDVDKYNNDISGSSNAYTTDNHTLYYGKYPDKYLSEALFYQSQIVFHPLFEEEAISKERTIILDELKRNQDDLDFKIYDNFRRNRYKVSNSPFSFSVIGTIDNVSRFTREDILNHYAKYYVPENIEVYLVGNFDEDEARKLIDQYFNKELQGRNFAKAGKRLFINNYPEYSDFKISTSQKGDIDQYYLTLSFPTRDHCSSDLKDRIAIPYLNSTVASSQYQSSLLYKRLREELGLVYGVSLWTYESYSRSSVLLETSFKPDNLKQIFEEIYIALEKVKKKSITDEIFETMRKRKFDTLLMALDDPSAALSWLYEQEEELLYRGRSYSISEYISIIEKYEFDEILRLGDELIDWSKLNIGVVSKDEPEEVRNNVAQIWNSIIKNETN